MSTRLKVGTGRASSCNPQGGSYELAEGRLAGGLARGPAAASRSVRVAASSGHAIVGTIGDDERDVALCDLSRRWAPASSFDAATRTS